jgi:hypothetical protein
MITEEGKKAFPRRLRDTLDNLFAQERPRDTGSYRHGDDMERVQDTSRITEYSIPADTAGGRIVFRSKEMPDKFLFSGFFLFPG